MKHRKMHLSLALAAPIALILTSLLLLSSTHAGGAGQVGLVVRFGDDSVITRCVGFSEPEISGYDVLMNSGLDVVAAGGTICDIEGESGCPVDDCFCRCHGTPCFYWTYWHLADGDWEYAQQGAAIHMVHNGDVEGWSWGTGTPPPVYSFDQICAPSLSYSHFAYLPVTLRQ